MNFSNLKNKKKVINNQKIFKSLSSNTFKNKIEKNSNISQENTLNPTYFDIQKHFKYNLREYKNNCPHLLNSTSIYCKTCKKSLCEKCFNYFKFHKNDEINNNNENEHIFFKKEKYLKYNENNFINIEESISHCENEIITKKNYIINLINSTITTLKNHLNKIKENSLKDVEIYFNNINQYIIYLKEIEKNIKNNLKDFYINNKNFINFDKNYDLDNSLFFIYYDINKLLNLKNNKIKEELASINNNFYSYENDLNLNSNLIKNINIFSDKFSKKIEFDDYYWDVKLRIKKYNEHFKQFKNNISEILKKNNKGIEKIKNLIDIFDEKNLNGKEIIFNQEFFINNLTNKNNYTNNNNNIKDNFIINENNDLNSQTIDINKLNNNNKQLIHSAKIKKRGNSKSKLILSPNSKSYKTNYNTLNHSKNSSSSNILKLKKTNSIVTNKNKSLLHSNSQTSIQNNININPFYNITPNDIKLNNNIIQRFFSYTLYDTYNKYFSNNNKSINSTTQTLLTTNFLAQYNIRYNQLKEYCKPIINSNYISIYNPKEKKIEKKKINLDLNKNGYKVFPEGCRHILINNLLYITGGEDYTKEYSNQVNCIDLQTFQISNISNSNKNNINLIYGHAYHSIEYLENFECLILIGGENNNKNEIFDLNEKKWFSLPNLNYPRSNTNLYYNKFTNDLFVLFGIEGKIKENKFSDKIEVIELNDIKSGFYKIDYYKESDINLNLFYCKCIPFMKEKLIIFGGNNNRQNGKFFVMFDMNKNEITKVDKNIIDELKLEEKNQIYLNSTIQKIEN